MRILLFFMLGCILCVLNLAISYIISTWQGGLFYDHIIDYFQAYNVYTIQGELMTPAIETLQDVREIFVPNEFIQNVSLVFTILASVAFVFFYRKFKQLNVEDDPQKKDSLKNDLKNPLLLSIFFAIGLAFYFSAIQIEDSMLDTISIILSNMQPFTDSRLELNQDEKEIVIAETFGSKITLISSLIVDKTKAFSESSFNQIYFFIIAGFLFFGVISIYLKSKFFTDAFFFSSLFNLFIWIMMTPLRIIMFS